jgi:hypothetical protein
LIRHGMQKYPSVTVIGIDGAEYEGEVRHMNNLAILFRPFKRNSNIKTINQLIMPTKLYCNLDLDLNQLLKAKLKILPLTRLTRV